MGPELSGRQNRPDLKEEMPPAPGLEDPKDLAALVRSGLMGNLVEGWKLGPLHHRLGMIEEAGNRQNTQMVLGQCSHELSEGGNGPKRLNDRVEENRCCPDSGGRILRAQTAVRADARPQAARPALWSYDGILRTAGAMSGCGDLAAGF